MKKNILVLVINLFVCSICHSQTKSKNILLLLGAGDLPTLTNRVNIALDFYHIKKIDKIIVSGGCGAHASGICEATEMKNRLVAKGVPENIIYKEENSKTTVQNYIFSRVLRDELGKKIIRENDSLFVVSNHWHAIAVAARFNKYDHVHAKFFIDGDLAPKENALLDYGGLYNRFTDNNEFILKGTWATPDGVYNRNGFTNYIFLDRIYSIKNNDTSTVSVNKISKLFPSLPKNWESIDASTYDPKDSELILFNNQKCQLVFKDNQLPINLDISELIIGLPVDIKYVDACFIKENDLYLFARNKVVIAKRVGKKFKVFSTEEIKTMVNNWPYAWGSGNVSAADYNTQEKAIYLYKNEQYIKLNEKSHLATEPKKLEIKWQNIR